MSNICSFNQSWASSFVLKHLVCFTYNRYRAQYHINKVTYSKRFKTKEEAQDWLDEQMLEIKKNNLINN